MTRINARVTARIGAAVALLAAYAVSVPLASQRTASSMAATANRFLAGLSVEQRAQATFPIDADERLRWHYIPNEMFPRKGVTIKAMTEAQRGLAHELLKTGLSQRGYMTATAIMDLETILKALERNARFARDREEYLFTVFGTPSATGAWGWRVDGHHVSLNFTVVNGAAVASSPTFLGSNPAEVREGPRKGLRILGAEEDAARTFLDALDPSQRAAAILSTPAPGDILTENHPKIDRLSPAGLKAASLTARQREILMQLVDVYVGLMAADIAAERLEKLRKAGIENVTFTWAGETERGKKHYYRVQGPTFLIEYDNTQDDGNHIHSVWRDFDGDYGRDLIREHLKTTPH